MSEHDPYDGNYDDAPAPAAAPQADSGTMAPEAPSSSSDTSTAEPPPEPAVEVSVYTHTQLERMRKADLQAVARERGLDNVGDRDDLIERIEAAQGANA